MLRKQTAAIESRIPIDVRERGEATKTDVQHRVKSRVAGQKTQAKHRVGTKVVETTANKFPEEFERKQQHDRRSIMASAFAVGMVAGTIVMWMLSR